MGKYVAKRLGMAAVTIFLVTCLTFLLMNAVPGSPWLSWENAVWGYAGGTECEVWPGPAGYRAVRQISSEPVEGWFWCFFKDAEEAVRLSIIKEMFPVSAKVGAIALCWAVLVGVPLGCLSAFKRGKLTDSILQRGLYLRYFHAKLRSGVYSAGCICRRCPRGSVRSRPSLIRHREWRLMCFRVLHWDSIRCVTRQDRPVLLCWIPWIRSLSKQQERRA